MVQTFKVKTSFSDLAVSVSGDDRAPPLILSNSMGTTREMWARQQEVLRNQFRLITYDTCGHGASAVKALPSDLSHLGADVIAILDHLHIDKVSFCGVSLGAMTGLWLAANCPDRITQLIASNGAAYVGQPDVWNKRIATVRSDGLRAITDALIGRWFTEPFVQTFTDEVAGFKAQLLNCTPDAYIACCNIVRDMDLRKQLQHINCPILVIAGVHDVATPLSLSQQINKGVEGAKLLKLQAAHLANVEDSTAFSQAAVHFLTDQNKGS